MNKNTFVSIVFFLSVMTTLINAQTNLKIWTETTSTDFSDNQLINLSITARVNGEVELAPPLQNTLADTQNDTIPRYVGRNKKGDYASSWIIGNNVFARKYKSDGSAIGKILRINDVSGRAGEFNRSYAAMLDNGIYLIVWTDRDYNTQHEMWGQLIKDDTVKIGGNFRINLEERNWSNYLPSAIADNNSNTFLIFYTLKYGEGYRIFVQRRDTSGAKIGETVFLNSTPATIYEGENTVAADKDGFITVWWGGNTNISNDCDIFLRHYDWNLQPLGDIQKVNDDGGKTTQMQPDVAVDDKGNALVVWIDDRSPHATSNMFNCFAQAYDSAGVKTGRNIQLNSSLAYWLTDADFLNGEFQVSWQGWNETYRRYESYYTRWKLEPKTSGEMISSIFNSGSAGSVFEKISWKGSTYSSNEITFRIRTGRSFQELQNCPWYGPSDTSGYYMNGGGEEINTIHNGGSYLQYKAFLKAGTALSPSLSEVSISYISNDFSAPQIPEDFSAAAGHSSVKLSWKANAESDLKGYVIFRTAESGKYDNAVQFIVHSGYTVFTDTTAVSGTVYYYVITAEDSSYNRSGFSNEVNAVAYSVDIYVSAGAGNGDGSFSNPFGTIKEAFENSFYGDTVKVLPGNYSQAFEIKEGVSLSGTDAEQCIINTHINAADHSVIKRLTLTRSVTCDSASPVITENIFTGSKDYYAPAVYLRSASNAIITKNYISECNVGIISVYKCQPVIKNNIIQINEAGIIVHQSATIINNTIIAKKYSCISLIWGTGSTIENNILVTLEETSQTNPVGQNNIHTFIYNAYWNPLKPGSTVPETNLFIDPGFLNMAIQDYRLAATSPCINAGNPASNYNDKDGTRNDMGAFGGPEAITSSLSSQLTKSIFLSNASGYPGDTISIYLSLDDLSGLGKAELSIIFDSSILQYTDAVLPEGAQNFTLTKNIISSDKISLNITVNSPAEISQTEIAVIRFLVNPDAKSNDACSITLENVSLVDINSKNINIKTVTNGSFIVNFISESAHIVFVDSKYAGNETGDREHPFNTISEGINEASAGDTVFVQGGIYNETVTVKEGIYLIGSGVSTTYIVLSNDNMGVVFYNIHQAELSGFTIRGDNTHFFAPLLSCNNSSPLIKKNRIESERNSDEGIIFENGSEAVFENNYLNTITLQIIKSSPLVRENVIEGSLMGSIFCSSGIKPIITNNILKSSSGSGALRMYKSGGIIRNNIIFGTPANTAVVFENCNEVKFSNNIVIDKSPSGNGVLINECTATEVINNTISTGGRGIEEKNSVSSVSNNIVVNNNTFGVQLSPESAYDYNDVWNNYVNYNSIDPGPNDISLDPLFSDLSKDDYRLSFNSPCIDAGSPDTKFNDRDGSRNDIGAYGGPFADSSAFNKGGSLGMDSLSYASDDTIQVFIKGSGLHGITELDLSFSFDAGLLKPINVYTGDITKGFAVERTNLNSSSVNIHLTGAKELSAVEGDLAVLMFAAKKNISFNTAVHFDSAKVKDETSFSRYIYNLKDGQISITSGVEGENIVKEFELYQNYPNPFNPSTKIRYELPGESRVTLKIYDILGKETSVLVNGLQKSGRYELFWNAGNCASGIYFYVLNAGGKSLSRKMMLIK